MNKEDLQFVEEMQGLLKKYDRKVSIQINIQQSKIPVLVRLALTILKKYKVQQVIKFIKNV